MESSRKIAAGLIGVLVLIFLFFAAKWTGDRIRERFLKPKSPAVVATTKPPTTTSDNLLGEKATPTATYSAIPSTGPNDLLYVIAGIMFISGIAVKLYLRSFQSLHLVKSNI